MRRQRCGFYRAFFKVLTAAGGAVRLRQDADYLVPCDERRQGGQREFRRAGEGDAQRYQPVEKRRRRLFPID
jgi:hypothetical protein